MQNGGGFRTQELLVLDQTMNVQQISNGPLPWSLASWRRARGRGWTQPEPAGQRDSGSEQAHTVLLKRETGTSVCLLLCSVFVGTPVRQGSWEACVGVL